MVLVIGTEADFARDELALQCALINVGGSKTIALSVAYRCLVINFRNIFVIR